MKKEIQEFNFPSIEVEKMAHLPYNRHTQFAKSEPFGVKSKTMERFAKQE
ncbi:MAG: hypothetical protein JEZ09_06710 [Salinivirgaceae bacterium]|nr:hypothetical protein [Salinivirgaceae bacterium]